MKVSHRLILWNVLLTIISSANGQSLDSVDTSLKIVVRLHDGSKIVGAYHSHTEDQILILHPYNQVKTAIRSGNSDSVNFSSYNFYNLKFLQARKRSAYGGLGTGSIIGAITGVFVGLTAIASEGPFISISPGAGALIGALVFAPSLGVVGAAAKAGTHELYEFDQTATTWTITEFERLTSKIERVQNRKEQRLFFIGGVGYSSEEVHIGMRYYFDHNNDLNLVGSFLLADLKGFGIEYRQSFGKAKTSAKGAWFWLAGVSYKWVSDTGPRRDERTYYISGSLGRNFYLTPNSGFSIDLGYDYATSKGLKEKRLKSYLGPRFQFFF